jgi:hypothetical protein
MQRQVDIYQSIGHRKLLPKRREITPTVNNPLIPGQDLLMDRQILVIPDLAAFSLFWSVSPFSKLDYVEDIERQPGFAPTGISKNSNLVHGMFSPAGPADQAIRYLAGLVRVADGSAGQMTGATGVPQLADWQGSRNPKADFGGSTCWFD